MVANQYHECTNKDGKVFTACDDCYNEVVKQMMRNGYTAEDSADKMSTTFKLPEVN